MKRLLFIIPSLFIFSLAHSAAGQDDRGFFEPTFPDGTPWYLDAPWKKEDTRPNVPSSKAHRLSNEDKKSLDEILVAVKGLQGIDENTLGVARGWENAFTTAFNALLNQKGLRAKIGSLLSRQKDDLNPKDRLEALKDSIRYIDSTEVRYTPKKNSLARSAQELINKNFGTIYNAKL